MREFHIPTAAFQGEKHHPGISLPHQSHEARWARCSAPQAGCCRETVPRISVLNGQMCSPGSPKHTQDGGNEGHWVCSMFVGRSSYVLSFVKHRLISPSHCIFWTPSTNQSAHILLLSIKPFSSLMLFLRKVTWITQFSTGLLCAQLLLCGNN